MLSHEPSTSDFTLVDRTDDRMPSRALPADARVTRHVDDAPPRLSDVIAEHQVGAAVIDALIDRLPIGIAIADRDGRVIYANAAARAFPLADLPHVEMAVGQALLTGSDIRDELREYRAPGGARRWLTISVTPVRAAAGESAAALITLVDATADLQASEWRPLVDSLMRL